jgi:hypothetical protein
MKECRSWCSEQGNQVSSFRLVKNPGFTRLTYVLRAKMLRVADGYPAITKSFLLMPWYPNRSPKL